MSVWRARVGGARPLIGFGILLSVALLGMATQTRKAITPDRVIAFTTGTIPADHILLPAGAARSVFVLVSGDDGWGAADQALAQGLLAQNAAVIGIGLPQYLGNLARKPEDCHYLISDIESLSHQIQRATGSANYEAPILAGAGVGGGLALDLVTQTPAATIGATIVANPAVGVALDRPLCTAATHTDAHGEEIYTLPAGALADPVAVLLTPDASGQTRDRVLAFAAKASSASVVQNEGSAQDALATALLAKAQALNRAAAPLPIQVLATAPTHGTMAIILSGDGGWRDLDKTIGGLFQQSGVPTVGLDSLRYFWTKRSPQDLAKDITGLVATYSAQWNTPDVLLVGYSFGADVLPETWAALDPATQARIKQISLLGVSPLADWEVTVSGWLRGPSGAAQPTAAALAQIPATRLQCVYGVDEADSPCPGLAATGVEAVQTQGGHHFDGNYVAIAQKIIHGLDLRRANGGSK
jgi:type IV secretory pathway VirJ component